MPRARLLPDAILDLLEEKMLEFWGNPEFSWRCVF